MLDWIAPVLFTGVAFVSALLLYRLISGAKRTNPMPIRLSGVDDEGPSAAAYVAGYLFPFVSIDFADWRVSVSYLIVYGVLYVIAIRSRYGLINPTLYLFGYRISQATLLPSKERVLVICRVLPTAESVVAYKMSGGFLIKEDAAH
ncbi:hypothetical protein [Leifsonia sp. WHRI 6310E]|uniref:hypothetical protein n=1 Tax=Leifsonia sp. WHRI 6310E TaxID=3162562 RepID=UPI0032EB1F1B